MNLLKMLIVWSMVAVFSFLLSRWLGTVLSPEINSVILIAAGAVATLTNAASFQVLRRLDEPPTKDLSPERAERVIRLFERRRKSFRAKWFMAILMGILSAIGGGLLRLPQLNMHYDLIVSASYLAFGFAVTIGMLIAIEFTTLSKIARDLPREIEERQRKEELLARLCPHQATATIESIEKEKLKKIKNDLGFGI